MKRHLSCCAIAILFLAGCERPSTVAEPAAVPAPVDSPEENAEDLDIAQSIQSLYEQAKETGATNANSVKQWLGETLEQSVESSEATAEQSAEWISEQFQRAKSTGETTATSARDWVAQDIQRMGSWQYTSVSFPSSTSPQDITKQLNELGAKRWECMLVDSGATQKTFYFKRTERSYLKQIPARDLLKLVPMLGGSEEAP